MLHIRTDNAADLDRIHAWLRDEVPDISHSVLHAMQVVLEEVVTNSAKHGFPPGVPGEIRLRLSGSEDELVLIVEDHGYPFDPTTAFIPERGKDLNDIEPGGLGMTLMRHFCKDISYRRAENENRLTMRFPLT